MTDQTTPAPAAPAAGAPSVPSPSGPAAAVAELAALRAKQPGVRFNQLPPSVAALLDGAAPADGAATPAQSAGDGSETPQGTDAPAGSSTQDPADAAIAHAAETYGGDNAPMSALDAMQARVEIAHQLQVADEIPGLDAGVADLYGKRLATALENPPTRAQKLQAWSESDRMLRQLHPNGKHEKVLAAARAELKQLAARIPKLPGWLERTGGANDIEIITRLAQRHTQRAAARIVSAARRR